MKPYIINISPEYEVLLPLLYPEYALVQNLNLKDRFIIKHDVKSMADKNRIEFLYNDCIFISNKIFNEVWNEEVIKLKIIEFARVRFKSRRRTFPDTLNPIDDFYKFVLSPGDTEDDSQILELFNAFGSTSFINTYFSMCEKSSVPQVNAAIFTFISKILSDSSSIFYKKKKMVLESKIKNNFTTALDAYNSRIKDDYGLSSLKFFMDLWK